MNSNDKNRLVLFVVNAVGCRSMSSWDDDVSHGGRTIFLSFACLLLPLRYWEFIQRLQTGHRDSHKISGGVVRQVFFNDH